MRRLRNWSGTLDLDALEVHRPRSVEEIQDIVSRADHVRAFGTLHSFSDIVRGDELVSVAGLDIEPTIDAEARTVTVGAASTYGALCRVLDADGFALANLASLPHISVAGACATGTHGSGDRNGALSTAVAAIELVDGTGELRRADRSQEGFAGYPVNLGSLGVVTRLTLDIEPAYLVRQRVYEHLPWSLAFDRLDEVMAAADSVSLFTNWVGEAIAQVWLKSRVRMADDDEAGVLEGVQQAEGQVHPIPEAPVRNCTVQGGAPGPWWDRLPHFRMRYTPSSGDEIQSEYLVPRAQAVTALMACRALSAEISPLLQISEIRTVAGDDLWMSPFQGRDSLAIHFTWIKDVNRISELLPALEERLHESGARPHWGKTFSMGGDRIRQLYPHLADFRELASRLDPRQIFVNSFMRRTGVLE